MERLRGCSGYPEFSDSPVVAELKGDIRRQQIKHEMTFDEAVDRVLHLEEHFNGDVRCAIEAAIQTQVEEGISDLETMCVISSEMYAELRDPLDQEA